MWCKQWNGGVDNVTSWCSRLFGQKAVANVPPCSKIASWWVTFMEMVSLRNYLFSLLAASEDMNGSALANSWKCYSRSHLGKWSGTSQSSILKISSALVRRSKTVEMHYGVLNVLNWYQWTMALPVNAYWGWIHIHCKRTSFISWMYSCGLHENFICMCLAHASRFNPHPSMLITYADFPKWSFTTSVSSE